MTGQKLAAFSLAIYIYLHHIDIDLPGPIKCRSPFSLKK